jgi:hypothetical protein
MDAEKTITAIQKVLDLMARYAQDIVHLIAMMTKIGVLSHQILSPDVTQNRCVCQNGQTTMEMIVLYNNVHYFAISQKSFALDHLIIQDARKQTYVYQSVPKLVLWIARLKKLNVKDKLIVTLVA